MKDDNPRNLQKNEKEMLEFQKIKIKNKIDDLLARGLIFEKISIEQISFIVQRKEIQQETRTNYQGSFSISPNTPHGKLSGRSSLDNRNTKTYIPIIHSYSHHHSQNYERSQVINVNRNPLNSSNPHQSTICDFSKYEENIVKFSNSIVSKIIEDSEGIKRYSERVNSRKGQ